VAQKNGVLTTPAPSVTLDEFAASSINFTLYAFIDDVTKSAAGRTDLAIAILDAFAEAAIAIPSGRAEITICNMDTLRDVIAQSVALRPGKSAANGGVSDEDAAPIATAPTK
jgi:small-conductance mechanosensitive channel